VGRVKVIVDDFDPPVEAAYAFSETKPSTAATTYGRILEMLTLNLASSIITLSEFWTKHFARIYHIRQEKFFVVSNGSLVRYIRNNPTKTEDPFTVLYAGSAMKVKDADKLVTAVAKLREKGLCIDLHFAGAKELDLPQWVNIASYDWPNFVDGILFQSDVCVIPYPPNKLTFFHAVPAKLFDYMAAGKPIISTNLQETGNLIRKYNCGLVAKSWKEFELYLEKLYYDREFAKKLGENGRKAVEKYFDYELLAETLLQRIVKTFES
jgi:glycosyltransferase involved in cell wall biosynthesis